MKEALFKPIFRKQKHCCDYFPLMEWHTLSFTLPSMYLFQKMTFHSQFSLQLLPKWQTMCYRESSFMSRPKFSASFALPCWLCIYSHTLHYWALSKHNVLIQSSSPAVRQPATPTLNRGRWPREIGQGSSKPLLQFLLWLWQLTFALI